MKILDKQLRGQSAKGDEALTSKADVLRTGPGSTVEGSEPSTPAPSDSIETIVWEEV